MFLPRKVPMTYTGKRVLYWCLIVMWRSECQTMSDGAPARAAEDLCERTPLAVSPVAVTA